MGAVPFFQVEPMEEKIVQETKRVIRKTAKLLKPSSQAKRVTSGIQRRMKAELAVRKERRGQRAFLLNHRVKKWYALSAQGGQTHGAVDVDGAEPIKIEASD